MAEAFVIAEGQAIPTFTKAITQESINLYASASGDFNPIHVDLEFAKKSLFGSTVAHGMLGLACVSAMMAGAFGKDWLETGILDVKFKAAARPGDIITVTGEIKKIESCDKGTVIRCTIGCANQKGEAVIFGEAKVTVPK
jgi:acyl dehydratase